MTRKQSSGPLDLSPKGDDFFIGFAPPPAIDRRAMLALSFGLIASGAAAGYGLAKFQRPPGPGQWDQGAIFDLPGVFLNEPYPILRTSAVDGSPKTCVLVCFDKCGVGARISDIPPGPATIKGTLIRRGDRAQIAVVNGEEWHRAGADLSEADFAALSPAREADLGEYELYGEILDSKCWFGAMRPGEGKPHKSCAALCIASGVPPSFYARDAQGREDVYLITDAQGGAMPPYKILDYVGDPVRARGRLVRAGDITQLRLADDAVEWV